MNAVGQGYFEVVPGPWFAGSWAYPPNADELGYHYEATGEVEQTDGEGRADRAPREDLREKQGQDRVASAGVASQRLGSTVGLRGAPARAGRSPLARDARRS